jgi:tRNA pseudouridine55 synthase
MKQIEKPSGLLLIDKQLLWTSFDVVNKIRFILTKELGIKPKQLKVGHSGTLDPSATGLLVLAIGSATKNMDNLTKQDKKYEVGSILGVTSTTGDNEGDLSINESAAEVTEEHVHQALSKYVGEIKQRPHKYSAVKVDGVRAYKLARAGKEVELKPRIVTINSIEIIDYRWPQLLFDAEVSSGTYIRSLVEDIGVDLGVGAYMNSLRRTEIGKYKVSDAHDVQDLDYQTIIDGLLPLD